MSMSESKIKELLDAAYNGDLKKLEKLEVAAKNSAIMQFSDETGKTVLLSAAHGGQLEVVKYLLKYKISNINEQDKNQNNLAVYALASNQWDLIRFLITEHSKLFARKNKDNCTLVHYAALYGNIKALDLFLDNKIGGGLQDEDKDGLTPFLRAIVSRKLEMARHILDLLKERKLEIENPKSILKVDTTALIQNRWNDIEMASFLLQEGAYLDYVCKNGDNKGKTVRQIVEGAAGGREILPLLRAAESLMNMAQHDSTELLSEILNALGNSLNARRFEDGNTALHLAILNNKKWLVKNLCAQGANIHILNHKSVSPFILAQKSDCPVIRCLLNLQRTQELVALSDESQSAKEMKTILEHQRELPALVKQLVEAMEFLVEEDRKLIILC